MRKIFLFFVLTVILLMKTNGAYGGRPFMTEDAGVAGKGVMQLELGSEYAKQSNGENESSLQFVPIYGVTDWMELSAELPYKFAEDSGNDDMNGFEDMLLGLKTQILKEERAPALLLKTVVKFDNGDESNGLGSGDMDIGFVAAATKRIGDLTLHANIGYTFVGNDFDPNFTNYILYGVAGEYSFKEKINLMAEIYGESNSHFHIGAFKQHDLQTLLGLTYQLTEKIILDSGIKIGLLENSPDLGLTLGLSINF